MAARRVVGARAPRAACYRAAHHAPQFKQMHDAMRAAAAEVQFEPPEPRPERQSKRTDPYGNGTKVLGLETCAAFRAANPIISSRRFAPAGLFNSATNALWQTILSNCRVSEHGRNDLFHPPWGKHNPASWRGRHLGQYVHQFFRSWLAAAHGERAARRDGQGPADVVAVDLPPPLRRAPLVEAANKVPPGPSTRPSPWRSSGPRWCTTITWWTCGGGGTANIIKRRGRGCSYGSKICYLNPVL